MFTGVTVLVRCSHDGKVWDVGGGAAWGYVRGEVFDVLKCVGLWRYSVDAASLVCNDRWKSDGLD